MISALTQKLKQDGCYIEEAQVFSDSELVYWHSTIISKDKIPLASGFGEERLTARKIAISELLERRAFLQLRAGGQNKQWGFKIIPTACGFAAGFDQTNTIIRSVSEAVERWVMSNWIDNKCFIERHRLSPPLKISDTGKGIPDEVLKKLGTKGLSTGWENGFYRFIFLRS